MLEQSESSAPVLTYSDVHMILALAEGWPAGAVSLRYNGLIVDAVLRAPSAPAASRPEPLQIGASAVGTFKSRAPVGAMLKAGDTIGVIEAPGEATSVVAPMGGTLVALSAENGGFVEFDQTIATIEPIPGN